MPEHAERAATTRLAGRIVALTGQWWLEVRNPGKDEVTAHLVNLA